MLSTFPSTVDQPLYDLVSGPAPTTIADVILRMEAIDTLLPANDGIKWFNRLYLMVTKQIDLQPPGGAWQSPIWFTRLDVVFAGFYFNAVRDFLVGTAVPSSWRALFEARYQPCTDRIQWALAGMNAHINHDLSLALVAVDAELNISPTSASLEYADYESVNTLLNTVMPSALTMLAEDTLGVLAQDTGKVGRLLAYWNICRARDLAWDFANHLGALPKLSRNAALIAQDGVTGCLGRAILALV
ncbi:MAG: DUF5995 family protein [Bryocella sp.]